jgi:hypothetical protein
MRRELDEACGAFKAGDCAAAAGRARAVSAIARAARDLAAFEDGARTLSEERDVEEIRAELERRIARVLNGAATAGIS